MRGAAQTERDISAQSCPVSGMDRAASRTTPDTIFFGLARTVLHPLGRRLAEKNRARHRRWRGRFAILDPARSIPAAPSCLSDSGGDYDVGTAYRGTARRASGHPHLERASADQGRTESRAGGTGAALAGGSGLAAEGLTGEGRSGAAGAALLLSCCSRLAVFGDLGAVGAGRSRIARLKVNLLAEINLLSAHHYFTGQAGDAARQGKPNRLIFLTGAGDRRRESDGVSS